LKSTELLEADESPSVSRRELFAQIETEAKEASAQWTKKEQALHYEKVALETIAAWVKIRSLAPIVSSNPDPDPVKRNEKLTYNLIDWIVDIENATLKALENQPGLQQAWFAIAMESAVNVNDRHETLQRCGRVYAHRELAPWQYWRRNRYIHREPSKRNQK
jgi:hypothetical protein